MKFRNKSTFLESRLLVKESLDMSKFCFSGIYKGLDIISNINYSVGKGNTNHIHTHTFMY